MNKTYLLIIFVSLIALVIGFLIGLTIGKRKTNYDPKATIRFILTPDEEDDLQLGALFKADGEWMDLIDDNYILFRVEKDPRIEWDHFKKINR